MLVRPSTSAILAAALVGLACPGGQTPADPPATPRPTVEPTQPAPAAPKDVASLSDDELVARVTAFAGAFAAVVADKGAECAGMGEGLEAVLAANQDILALSARLKGEDSERKDRLKARVKPVTDGVMAPHMEALRACGDDPKVAAVLERMPSP